MLPGGHVRLGIRPRLSVLVNNLVKEHPGQSLSWCRSEGGSLPSIAK